MAPARRRSAQPRTVKVIALDAPSERVVKRLAQSQWNRASFFTASAFAGAPRQGERFSMQGWLSDLAGRTKDLMDEVDTADLVVMVAASGENAQAALNKALKDVLEKLFNDPNFINALLKSKKP